MTLTTVDVTLVGAGIMGATLGTLLRQLQPDLRLLLVEGLPREAQESSSAWNNAGTGHAGNCELNYTPMAADGSISLAKALDINEAFDLSRQFWTHLVRDGALGSPGAFIQGVPHMSFVLGEERRAYLRERHRRMAAHHCYAGMAYSEDHAQVAEWAPLLIEGRDPAQAIGATHIAAGTDVNFGALTSQLLDHLRASGAFEARFSTAVQSLRRRPEGGWRLETRDRTTGETRLIDTGTVFLGAGGGALTLLQKSGIPEGRGYGGFPVSGLWLRCGDPALASRHHAKVYGMAAAGSPPMSVPHLDTRLVDGRQWILFGPYAGFSSKFLKSGSLCDWPRSLRAGNLLPLLAVGRDNLPLTEYLIGQVFASAEERFAALRDFYPDARPSDWTLAVAGQRVQIIKADARRGGVLQFGTEVVHAADTSLVAVLGASPGASAAVAICLEILHSCFRETLPDGWQATLKRMLPSYGASIRDDADLCRRIRSESAEVLGLAAPAS
ncbi:malate dehydrogenase (quinone) [Aphanothece minutissima]|uniref:Probable malate:quinone oxidoreductase n=1 Tax=Aphanothece cf. minutissima CCALA 015 TaxID=2107695 RepID=A0ABX5F9G5_9CHRO|nr:malate dehydrogenase (quinone) [Aphanothece minutissima]PSB38366.1 malate dehydrogenase (quinone) [Aphanothece cf. minutissima CCALA 015]